MRAYKIFCAALFAGFAVADHDLVFPIVHLGDAGEDDDEFKDFKAQVMEVNNDITTYSVGCASKTCAGWENLPDFTYTIAIGPNTFDFKYSDEPILSTHTACTFTGSPPTAASCEMTNKGTIRTSTLGYEHHFTVPDSSGDWEFWNIQSATLRVLDGTVAASTTTRGNVAASATSGSASNVVTPAPTAEITGANQSQASGSAPASGSAAVKMSVEGWMLCVGMVVVGWESLGW